ncbi:MAG: secA translation cis-regulator SecM [Pasteurella oralis]|uniref:secA translation cis-regulator SecM n=1 Tax=Pasteurella oralis TaxID=1071947 RepID=UPI002703653F|nr:secA translation cis-regulator SecM [Pasteurella oralis]
MMILTKGKHNFWSQLLLSMIAILALPEAQGLANQSNVANENYQNPQFIQQQISRVVALVQQVQQQQRNAVVTPLKKQNLPENKPHFAAVLAYSIPPIRAGPHLS